MSPVDFFVGAVSATLGALGIAAGVLNWEQCYQAAKVRWLVNATGRTAARLLFIGVGSLFVILGIAIACGFAAHKHLRYLPAHPSARRSH